MWSAWPAGSGEVAQPSPDLWDRGLELTEGDRCTLLQARDAVRHGEVCDKRWRRAHPCHVCRLVIDHERIGGGEVVRQPVPVTELRTDGHRQDARIVVDLERPRNTVVGRDDDRVAALRRGEV